MSQKSAQKKAVARKDMTKMQWTLKEMKRNFAFIDAEISHEGKVCTSCEMIYCTFSKEVAKKDFLFNGCVLESESQAF